MHALNRTSPRLAAGARLNPAEPAQPAAAQYLTFMLCDEVFAVDILQTREIIAYDVLTEVPLMPQYVRGVINLRGSVVPVMDLAARLGKTAKPVSKWTCIVIVEVENEEGVQIVGLMVDAVRAVVEISNAEIEPAPAFGARVRSEFLKGMGKIDGRFAILLNVDRIAAAAELGELAALEAGDDAAAGGA